MRGAIIVPIRAKVKGLGGEWKEVCLDQDCRHPVLPQIRVTLERSTLKSIRACFGQELAGHAKANAGTGLLLTSFYFKRITSLMVLLQHGLWDDIQSFPVTLSA